jgi:SAM-dependent methyltransferase
MNTTNRTNEEQTKMWNGLGGRGWVEAQTALDRMLQPYEDLLVAAAVASRGNRVLDVGCGTGATTLAVARALGPNGRGTGLDISTPMLALARERAHKEGVAAEFVHADAQTYAFAPASFDTIVSRFGVMFFDDSVAAFTNLRRAATRDATLWFAAWRSAAENPFMTAAERAATPFLPNLPPREPNAPGQFAFADRARVEGLLAASGWSEIDVRPIDVSCTLPRADLERYVTRIGPVGRAIQELDAEARAQLLKSVHAAFDPYVDGDEVRFGTACWIATARA